MFDEKVFKELCSEDINKAGAYLNGFINDKSPIVELCRIMYDVSFTHNLDLKKCYKTLKSIINKLPEENFYQAIYFLINIGVEIKNFDDVIKYCERFIKLGADESFLYSAITQAYYYKHNYDLALKYCEDYLSNMKQEDDFSKFILEIKVNIYIEQKRFEEIKTYLNKLYFSAYSSNVVNHFLLIVELKSNPIDYNKIDKILENVKQDDMFDALTTIMWQLRLNETCNKKTYYLDKMYSLIKTKEDLFVYVDCVAPHLLEEEKNPQALIDLLKDYKIEDITSESILFYLGVANKMLASEESFKKAIEYYSHPLLKNDLNAKYNIMAIAQRLNDEELLFKTYDEVKRIDKSLGVYFIFERLINKQEYNKVFKMAREIFSFKEMLITSKHPKYLSRTFKGLITKIKNDFGAILKTQGYLYGLYSFKCDLNKARTLIESVYENNKEVVPVLAIFGHIKELSSDYEGAFSLYKKGVELFKSTVNDSTLCYAYYIKALYEGKGVEKDEDKAYSELLNYTKEYKHLLIENDVILFSYLSIIRNENLEYAYELLMNTHFARFEVAKLYYLIWLAKILNKDATKLKKQFKKNIKKAPSMVRKHYSKENQNVLLISQ